MAKYELLIAANNEADLPSGHKRKKQGDIIAVKPYPWQWGSKEVDNYLIVIIETSKTFNELQAILLAKSKANDKRQFKISLANIKEKMPGLDVGKVENRVIIYQPFKTKSSITANEQIDPSKVDTIVSEVKEEEEFSIDVEDSPIIYDKDSKVNIKPSEMIAKVALEV